MYPLIFRPILKERVWGNRKLEELYHKKLPHRVPIGESWEISDRPGDVSVVENGPFARKDLHWLVEQHRNELLGPVPLEHGRFPLLIKILDAQQKLSLQVHPPADQAQRLGGEPKTEFWYIADAQPAAELYVGLKRGVTRAEFERRLADGTVETCFHRIRVKAGDAMFLPSGRVHAIGEGLVIFEIQQNSDTTYRVFDWNRAGLDGKPRALHIAESLASINFNDFEPELLPRHFEDIGYARKRSLVREQLFVIELFETNSAAGVPLPANRMQIIAVLKGNLELSGSGTTLTLAPGQFSLIPAGVPQATLRPNNATAFLRVEGGTG